MHTRLANLLLNRRTLLGAGLGAAASLGAPAALADGPGNRRTPTPALDLEDPAEHLRIFRKLSASEQDGAEVLLHYSGITFGVSESAEVTPLYGMVGISPVRTYRLDDGTVQFLANEIGLHTDLVTGNVIDRWNNPMTGETLDVWHLRNGPVNYSLTPATPVNTGGWRLVHPALRDRKGFAMPVDIDGDSLTVAIDAQARRTNPLQPDEWPRESVGEQLVYSEHNTWRARVADVASHDVASPEVFAAWHSLKPWRPWMQMGRRPGRIYNHLTARKITSFDAVPEKALAYAEKHFPEFLSAPVEWTGAYRDNWSHFREQRRPARPVDASGAS